MAYLYTFNFIYMMYKKKFKYMLILCAYLLGFALLFKLKEMKIW